MWSMNFRVIDSGVGTDLKDLAPVLPNTTHFEQVGTNYAKSQGIGLGLPIKLLSGHQLMGGGLRSEEQTGSHGSEFYFATYFLLAAL